MPRFVGYPITESARLASDEAAERVRVARSRLDHGKTFRQAKRESAWLQSESQFAGEHWGGTSQPQDPTADLIVVNISFSTIVTLVPYLTGNDARFLVEPYSIDSSLRNARAQAAWLNRFWRTQASGARRAVSRATHDSLVYGDGWGKVRWALEADHQGVETARLEIEAPSIWDVWLDPMADGLHNARWVAQRTRTTLAELKADGSYHNLDDLEIGLRADENESQTERYYEQVPSEGEAKTDHAWVEVYEFWDLVSDEMVAFSPNGRYPLKWVQETRCPLVSIENHWLPKQPYHMGDLEQIWSLQQELNKSRSQMITHRRRNISKYLVRDDAIDEEAEAALASEIVGQIVKIKTQEPLDQVIRPTAANPLTADAYNVSGLITQDIWEITGINEYLRGAAPQIRRTATEASIIEGASNIKAAHKLGKVEEFVRDIGTTVLAVAADVFPLTEGDELEIFITGRDAEALNKADLGERLGAMFEQGAPEDLLRREAQGMDVYGNASVRLGADIFTGVYQVEVVQNSTELRDPIFKEQKYREIFRQMLEAFPVLQAQGVTPNLRKIAELWLEAAGVQDIDDLFVTEGAPVPAAPLPGGPAPTSHSMPTEGLPNLDGLGPPAELLSALNTGALAPGETMPPQPVA